MSNQAMTPESSPIRPVPRPAGGEGGFSLVEVLVAAVILMTGLIAVAQMFVASTNQNMASRRVTTTAVLAQQKIEQLRALAWGFDEFGLPVSDFSSNIAVTPPTSSGGVGLQASPPNTLTSSTAGYVDYLDAYGEWVGTGNTPPPNAIYVRRWSIEPLPTNPNNTLVFQVLVGRISPSGPPNDLGRQVSLKTRKSI
ncbi:MAG: type IV pilus modification PilV family protein [Rhodospirillaceae bacterium]